MGKKELEEAQNKVLVGKREIHARLEIPIHNKKQMNYVDKAMDYLAKAGVTFDHGSLCGDNGVLRTDWELDASLKGARLKTENHPLDGV